MAGYSGTPLARKIGVRDGQVVYVDDLALRRHADPRLHLDLADLDLGVPLATRLPAAFDVGLLFCPDRARLDSRFGPLVERMAMDGMVWICWPKKAAKVPTDLDENLVRDVGLALGVVDVKVAAVDETWSGLKFVRRLKDR